MMETIEARELALSLIIRAEVAGMSADGELATHLRPLLLELLAELGIHASETTRGRAN